MRIAAARLHPYCLPLCRPWVAASAVLRNRRGLLLALKGDDGSIGWGDCAPLPSSGTAGLARVTEALEALLPKLSGRLLDEALDRTSLPPEVRWALETALADLAARHARVPLARFWGGEATTVAVNAALGALDADCPVRAVKVLGEGYSVAKIKVGVGDIDNELAQLEALVAATEGRLRLRLDANCAWSAADARRFLNALTVLPIDAVEEPLVNPTVVGLQALQADLPYPLAADESLPVLGAEPLLEAGAVRRLVVKPARIGGVAATRELANFAREAGVELVLTSVVDSAVGVMAAAHLAAALVPKMTHGLATLEWLEQDVAVVPSIREGRLSLGKAPGLGLEPRAGL